MVNGVRITDVTDEHCGTWIEGSSVNSPVEFSVAIVDLAIANGFEIETEAWEADRPYFASGEATFEMVEDLGAVTDFALDYLNQNVTEGFYFDFADGLVLFAETEPTCNCECGCEVPLDWGQCVDCGDGDHQNNNDLKKFK